MRFIKAAERVEHVAPHHHAGTGDADHVALCQSQAKGTRGIARIKTKGMTTRCLVHQKHAGLLHGAVGIEQLRADHTDFRALGLFDQACQPVRLADLDIVVEK